MNSRAAWGTGFMAVLGQTEGGVMAGVANPSVDTQGRADRQSHVHAHGPGALVTAVVDLNLQTNTTNTGTANRITQQNHSHNITGNVASASAVSGGVGTVPSVHAYTALNFIIRT